MTKENVDVIMPSKARKELVRIDRALALLWLSKSRGNRPLMRRQIEKLVRAARSGRWNPEAGEVRFDEQDRLIDGHHRLTAIAEADAVVYQWVAFDCRAETINDVDTGVNRSTSGMRAMRGEMNAKARSSIANAAANLICGEHFVLSLAEQDELLALVGEPLVEAAIRWNRDAHETRIASPGHVAGVLMALVKTHPDAEPFAGRLVSGDGESGEPARELARWLIKQRGDAGGGLRTEINHRIANAWVAFADGESRRFIRGKRKTRDEEGGIVIASRNLEALTKAARFGWARPFVENIKPGLLVVKNEG